jgi:hypothetical protein
MFFECEFEKGLEYYQRTVFPHWQGERIIGDSCPRNLYLPWVPERIYQTDPQAKLVICLRNPVARAFSHWQQWYSAGWDDLRFPEAIAADYQRIQQGLRLETEAEMQQYCRGLCADGQRIGKGLYRFYLDIGLYYTHIQRYVSLYSMNNIHIILFDDLLASPLAVIQDLRSFLSLDPMSYKPALKLHKNPGTTRLHHRILKLTSGLRKHPFLPTALKKYVERLLLKIEPKYKMDQDTREWLTQFYREPNRQLAEFLGRDLSHWV